MSHFMFEFMFSFRHRKELSVAVMIENDRSTIKLVS